MTQKRFKKMLMSKGYGRNAVNAIVKETLRSGKPYAEAIKIYNLGIDVSCVAEAFTNAVKQLQKVCIATAKAIGAFAETYNEAMKEG